MKKFAFAFIVGLLFSITPVLAQNYTTAVGARLGSPLSLSIKHFINESGAVEAYAGTRGYSTYRWYHVSAAYQYHKPLEIDGIENLNYYVGGGATVFFWNYDFEFLFGESYSSTSFGVQGYIGLDYTFDEVPLNLTLDWVPTIYLGDAFSTGFAAGFGSLGVRYILK